MSEVYGFNCNGQMMSQTDIDHEYDMWVIIKFQKKNLKLSKVSSESI